ncbi:immunity protein Imm33 domain-containing protein [Janibacter melonis]|uniref:immunity protein Imm33 domain-containing protein n=1 Tax=Janibacter melonis TaxID=262209 RepID=UPI001748C378|nr:hypothetical protein [Janibacter melonis]
MTELELPPHPVDAPVLQAPVDLGGFALDLCCAPSVASYAAPVVERFMRYHEDGQHHDGLRTMVGFSMWQLRQSSPGRMTIQAPSYLSPDPDLTEDTTDDLTTALWVEAMHDDVLRQLDVDGDVVDLSSGVMCTRAALKVVESGGDDELVLARHAPTSESSSGWHLSTAAKAGLIGRRESDVLAGLLVRGAPAVVALLPLPVGTTARLTTTRVLDVTTGEAPRRTTTGGTPFAAGERVTVEEHVDGLTVRATIAPALVEVARTLLRTAAAGGRDRLVPGAALQTDYVTYRLEQAEPDVLDVTSPDFSHPLAYRSGTTVDLTEAVFAHVQQQTLVGRAGVEAEPTHVDDTIGIQRAVVDALADGQRIGVVLDRMALGDADRLDDGTRRSGWFVWANASTELTEDQRAVLNVDAGEVHSYARWLAPYLALPVGTMVQLFDDQLVRAHLVDPDRLDAAVESGPARTMGELLADPQIARPILVGDDATG